MPNVISNIKTINSAVRTVLVIGACGVVGYGGWFGYDNYVKPSVEAKRAVADLEQLKATFQEQALALEKSQVDLAKTNADLQVSEELNDRLETSMKLLKVDRRIANVTVLDTGLDENGDPFMEVSFTEVNEQGDPIGETKTFQLQGEKFYVDGWIATFEDKYVEDADELRAASLFVFKSIYGDAEKPKDGHRLDIESMSVGLPGIYQDDQKRVFEQQIWSDFWRVCNDISLQHELGIRAVHGNASYVEAREGKTYQVFIRSSGGVSLHPIDEP